MTGREASLHVVKTLRERGHDAVFAGGCVRDMLMGRTPSDYDVATSATPDQIIELFPRTVPVGKAFGVVVVIVDGQNVETATFRSDGPYSDGRRPDYVRFTDRAGDVRRRDFTVNGLLFDPITEEVIDLVGGRADIDAHLIRAIGEPAHRFEEDRLRLLRAVRFATVLDFQVEPQTACAIRSLAPHITEVSAERVAEELRKITVHPRRARGLELMDRLGLLERVLPEVAAMKGVLQGERQHPEGDVFAHSLLSIEALRPDPSFELAMATLLHDVGKPATAEVVEGAIFVRHAPVGADIAQEICKRLKLSNSEAEHITWLVRNHMRFRDVHQMRDSTLKRLLSEPYFDDLAELIRCDIMGSRGDVEIYDYAMARKREFENSGQRVEPLLSGDDLISMGLKPGPLFRELLEALTDAQLEGKVGDREQAENFIRRLVDQKRTTGKA